MLKNLRAVGHVNEVWRQGVTQFEEFKMNYNSLYNGRFMSLAGGILRKERDERESRNKGRRNKCRKNIFFHLPSSRASRKMPRLPRLANKSPVVQGRITINCNNKTAKKTLFFTVLLVQFIGLC